MPGINSDITIKLDNMNSSIKYQKSIDKLLDEVYLHYIQSTEFNGLPLSSVTSCSKDETKDVLQKLIEKGDIYVLSSRVVFITIEQPKLIRNIRV